MRILMILLFCFFFICCSSKIERDRIEFIEKIVHNIDISNILLDSSSYNCNQKKVVINDDIRSLLKKENYIYWKDIQNIWHYDSLIGKRYETIRLDTMHCIVYFDKKERNCITFLFRLKNNHWCIDTAYNMDMTSGHFD